MLKKLSARTQSNISVNSLRRWLSSYYAVPDLTPSVFLPINSNSRPSHSSLYSVISSIPEGIFVPLSALSTRHLTPPFPATASPRNRHLY